jgi:enediyne biosynthesis protein E4
MLDAPLAGLCITVTSAVALSDADASSPHFVDVAAEAGLLKPHTGGSEEKHYIVEAKGGGAAFLDFDGDGDLDIYWVDGATLEVPHGGGNVLYRNDGSAGFTDVTTAMGVGGSGWGMGVVSADFDNDGDPELYVTNLRENLLYRNDADRFVDVTASSGTAVPAWSTGSAVADYDHDGDLDLYVANYLEFDPADIPALGAQWKGLDVFIGPKGLPAAQDVFLRNDGDGVFRDLTSWSRLRHPSPGYGLGVVFGDYDLDGYGDLYVANDSSPNFLYRNRGDGRFVDASLQASVAYGEKGEIQAGMGIAWGDYDADGDPDLHVTHFESEYNTIYRNDGMGGFAPASFESGLAAKTLPYVGFGTGFLDHDNDGDLDLFVANGHVYPDISRSGSGTAYAQPNLLFDNTGNGLFQLALPQAADSLGSTKVSRGAIMGDYDNDGDVDVFVSNLNDRPSLLRNEGGNRRNWLGVKLVGHDSNRDGVGATVRLVAEGNMQTRHAIRGSSFLSSEDHRLHFGLGTSAVVDTLEVQWPGGVMQRLYAVTPNRYIVVHEPTTDIETIRLRDHIYMLRGPGGNIAVCVGGDGILLVDSESASVTPAIQAAIGRLNPGHVAYILNTHFHQDHVGGSAKLAVSDHETRIIAHELVRTRLLSGPIQMKRYFDTVPAEGLPTLTFTQSLSLHFNGETVRATHYPRGHTDGDIVITFEDGNVIHLGDLFFNGLFPFVDLDYGGDVEGLVRAITIIRDGLAADAIIIPGHGPLGSPDDLARYHRMLVETTAIVREGMVQGLSLKQLKQQGLPQEWREWSWPYVPERRWIETIYWSLARNSSLSE